MGFYSIVDSGMQWGRWRCKLCTVSTHWERGMTLYTDKNGDSSDVKRVSVCERERWEWEWEREREKEERKHTLCFFHTRCVCARVSVRSICIFCICTHDNVCKYTTLWITKINHKSHVSTQRATERTSASDDAMKNATSKNNALRQTDKKKKMWPVFGRSLYSVSRAVHRQIRRSSIVAVVTTIRPGSLYLKNEKWREGKRERKRKREKEKLWKNVADETP